MKRISDKELDVIIQKLVRKTDKANQLFLKKIGNDIKKIKKLNYTQAHQLIQMLKYGSGYNKVVDEMGKLTNISQKDINSVFSNYAKIDQEFYKQFYQYKNKPYIPYSENDVLRRQTEALANISGEELRNLTRSRAIGYRITDSNGVTKFKGLRETYEQLLDEAMLNVGQGKDTFDSAIRKILKEIGGSGLRYLDYESGRSIRLDSMIQMHLKDGLRNLHNVNDELFGQEFGSDGVEISVHENPAEDHEEVQGHQFSNEQYIKLQETGIADDYEENSINIHTFRKDGTMAGFRPISQYNCYHYRFSILLGVNKPEFSKERLEAIKERNDKGFEFEGKHYTMYEGTQLQRKYEREVRKYKDIQILARESDDKELMYEAQRKINELTVNYKKLNDASGLQPMSERMRVSGYHKIKVVDSSIPKEEIKHFKSIVVEEKISFDKYRNIINNAKTLPSLEDDFDYKGFINEYNKWYNSLDVKELQETNNNYKKWFKTDMNTSNPIGEYLNKKFNYDAKPELIEEKDFWIDEDGEELKYHDAVFLDKNHWFRGVSAERYSEILKQKVPDRKLTKQYVDNFKVGDYYAGIGINGNGTYATESFSYAESYSKGIEEGMIYIIPKENAKIVSIDKLNYIKSKLPRYINNKDKLYEDFTTSVLSDNGYFAQILGYDIIDLGTHKIILNRGAIKVVK